MSSKRLATLLATIRFLYRCHPRAFLTSCFASLPEPLFYPAILLVLHQLLQNAVGPNGATQLSSAVAIAGLALVGLFLVQRLGIILRDSSSTILRQQAWVVISKQIMQKLPEVPYPLFENNAFQARYGLVIREASQQSITLVDSLLSTVPIFLGLIGVAATLLTLAPLLVVAMVLIAPNQLRMEVLTNMQVDASWQRDVRVYQSDLIPREHARLAETYLNNLKQLTARFAGLRTLAALVEVLGLFLALSAAGALISHQQITLASLAVILPGMAWLTGMLRSGIYQGRSLLDSLNYAGALFAFLAEDFLEEHAGLPKETAQRAAPGTQRLLAIRLHGVSYTYPENQKQALIELSCTFKPGLTAIVGTNGAGKSTLVKLLTGLVPPTTGELLAVVESGEAMPLETVAKAILFQDPSHFHFSIRQNVTMQSERTPGEDERIREVLRLAGLWEVVQALPAGLDTVVGAGFGGA